jgi:hypothetical protein
MDNPNQLELPKELIESLKQEKEDNKRRENIEKLNVALGDKQNNLSIDQTNQLRALRQSLESDTMQSLEDKAEANSVAEETLGLLTDIKDNTEDLNFEFSNGTKGIVEKILVFGRVLFTSFIGGFISGAMKIFQFPTLKKLFKRFVLRPLKATVFRPFILLFETIRNVFSALGDVYKKAGTGKFLKGNTYKILGARGIAFFEAIFKRVKSVVEFLKMIGGKIKTFFITLKGMGSTLLTRLITPFTNIKKAFLDIIAKLKPLGGAKAGPLSRIIGYVKNLGGLMTRFSGLFRVLGFAMGKLLWPVMMVIDAIRGMIHSFKTTEFTNPIAKGIDMILTGIGFAVGGFIGGIADLLKGMVSWVAEKLGFEGLSEWLDSFSIREMIEEGFGMMAEFFSTLFTDFVPALIAGIKAAAIPGGDSFTDAFNERLALGAEGYKEALEKSKQPANELSSVELLKEKRELEEEIAHQIREVNKGDELGGLIGFQFNRRERIAELRKEIEGIDVQVDANLAAMDARTAEINTESSTVGAQMEATQNDTLDAKEAKVNITPVITTTDASTNTSNIVSTSTNQNSHMDRTMGMGLGNMLLQ